MESDRCVKCGGPVGMATARCPLCGADQHAQPVVPPPFQPAIVGLQERRASLERNRQKARTRSVILGLAGIAGLLLISGLGYAGYKMIVVPPPPSAPPPPVETPPAAPLTLEGIAIANPARTDPTDLLPAVRRRLTEGSPDFRLVEIAVSRARKGFVDLTRPEPSISYRYLYEQNDPRLDKGALKRERVDLSLHASAPLIERVKPAAGDEPTQDPLCVWSAAWRAAVAAGFPADADVDARYGRKAGTDKSYWTLQVVDKPETKVELDGVTCSIRVSR